jgi:DNA-binding XRE family transcriptional regulator
MMRVTIPVWTQGERMAKLRKSVRPRLSREEMAAYIGVADTTITNWEHDKVRVPRSGMMAYANRCSDDPETTLLWLEQGDVINLRDEQIPPSSCNHPFGSYALRLFDPDEPPAVIDLRDHLAAQIHQPEHEIGTLALLVKAS